MTLMLAIYEWTVSTLKTNFSKELKKNYLKTLWKEFKISLKNEQTAHSHFILDSIKLPSTNYKLQMALWIGNNILSITLF